MKLWPASTFLLALCAVAALADESATQRAVIDASDKAALAEHMGKEVIIRGEVKEAAWSRSGKVMNISFKGAEESKLAAVIFEADRKAMDEAYAGDIGKALTGAKVRIEGRLQEYGGRVEALKGTPQIIIRRVTQITIVEPAPATQPG